MTGPISADIHVQDGKTGIAVAVELQAVDSDGRVKPAAFLTMEDANKLVARIQSLMDTIIKMQGR